MKKVILSIGLILGVFKLYAQINESSFQYVEIEGGVSVPLGNLKNTMNISPNIGLWLRQPHTEKSVWAFGFSINFPKKTPFQYKHDDYESETKPLSGAVGFRLDKGYPISKQKDMELIWSSALGYGFYLFDDVRARAIYASWPQSKKEEEDKPIFIKPFSTIHVSQGLQLRIRDFGVQARYNYAPYSVFSDIIDDRFGAHSVTVGLFYRQ